MTENELKKIRKQRAVSIRNKLKLAKWSETWKDDLDAKFEKNGITLWVGDESIQLGTDMFQLTVLNEYTDLDSSCLYLQTENEQVQVRIEL